MRTIHCLILLSSLLLVVAACESDDGGGGGANDASVQDSVDATDASGDVDTVDADDATAQDTVDDDSTADSDDDATDTDDTADADDADDADHGGDAMDADDGGDAMDADDTTDADDQGGEVVDFGFDIRVPAPHSFSCSTPWGEETLEQADSDWLCTFDDGETAGVVYVQSTPTDCQVTMSAIPVFSGVAGWISVDGSVTPVENGVYDWGGNHHNDMLSFDWQGRHYAFYHSSFGFGWRACNPMDCLQIFDADGVTSVLDGCTHERLLPSVCVEVKADGSYDDFVDSFEICPGDPNAD